MRRLCTVFILLLLKAHLTWGVASDDLSPLFVTGHPSVRTFTNMAAAYGALSPNRSSVAVYISARDVAKIRLNAKASVQLMPGEGAAIRVEGKVESVLRNADPKTGQGIASIGISKQTLPPRTYAAASIEISSRQALALPTTAVFIEGGKFFVFRETPKGDFAKAPVQVGNQSPDYTEIKDGLGPRDLVLIQGAVERAHEGSGGSEE